MNTYHVSTILDRFNHTMYSVHRNNTGIVLGEGNTLYHHTKESAEALRLSCIKSDTFHDGCDESQKCIKPDHFTNWDIYLSSHRRFVTEYMQEHGYPEWTWES